MRLHAMRNVLADAHGNRLTVGVDGVRQRSGRRRDDDEIGCTLRAQWKICLCNRHAADLDSTVGNEGYQGAARVRTSDERNQNN